MKAMRAERDERALRMSIAGHTYQAIADALGFRNRQAVHLVIKKGLEELTKKRNLAAEELRSKHIALLDEALAVAHDIMNKDHLAHGNGRVVTREVKLKDGSYETVTLLDDGPRLAAADRLIKISESQRKLLGIDAPAKLDQTVSGTIGYQIDASPDELEQL